MKEKKWHDHLNAEKVWQYSTSFHENIQQTKNTRKPPHHNKSHIWKTPNEDHIEWWKTESFSSKFSLKDVAFATSIQHSTGNHIQKIRREKESKTFRFKIKENNLFADDMTV